MTRGLWILSQGGIWSHLSVLDCECTHAGSCKTVTDLWVYVVRYKFTPLKNVNSRSIITYWCWHVSLLDPAAFYFERNTLCEGCHSIKLYMECNWALSRQNMPFHPFQCHTKRVGMTYRLFLADIRYSCCGCEGYSKTGLRNIRYGCNKNCFCRFLNDTAPTLIGKLCQYSLLLILLYLSKHP